MVETEVPPVIDRHAVFNSIQDMGGYLQRKQFALLRVHYPRTISKKMFEKCSTEVQRLTEARKSAREILNNSPCYTRFLLSSALMRLHIHKLHPHPGELMVLSAKGEYVVKSTNRLVDVFEGIDYYVSVHIGRRQRSKKDRRTTRILKLSNIFVEFWIYFWVQKRTSGGSVDTILRPCKFWITISTYHTNCITGLSKKPSKTPTSSLETSPTDTTPSRKRPGLSTSMQGIYPIEETASWKKQ